MLTRRAVLVFTALTFTLDGHGRPVSSVNFSRTKAGTSSMTPSSQSRMVL